MDGEFDRDGVTHAGDPTSGMSSLSTMQLLHDNENAYAKRVKIAGDYMPLLGGWYQMKMGEHRHGRPIYWQVANSENIQLSEGEREANPITRLMGAGATLQKFICYEYIHLSGEEGKMINAFFSRMSQVGCCILWVIEARRRIHTFLNT